MTEKQGKVMAFLWTGQGFSLKEVHEGLQESTKWSKTTVHTYLTRMEKQGFVTILRDVEPHRYEANMTREECTKEQRHSLLEILYQGATGELISAFLKEKTITREEKEALQQLLDDMEVE